MTMSTLFLVVLVTAVFADTAPTLKDSPRKPLYMIFARHPGKSDIGAREEGSKGWDAPISSWQNDKVKATADGTKKKGAAALPLEYNGARQLAKMLGKVTTNEQTTTLTTVPGVGENLVKIFASIDKRADNGFWQQDDKKKKAKEMFKELKKLFISTKTKFRFETSNLRRALLEEIVLRKSLEDAIQSDDFKALIRTSKGLNVRQIAQQKRLKQQLIVDNFKDSKFYILTQLAEKTNVLKETFGSKRSKTLLKGEWFTGNPPKLAPEHHDKFWNYAFEWGMPPDSESSFATSVKEALKSFVMGTGPYV